MRLIRDWELAQDGHLDFHTAPELGHVRTRGLAFCLLVFVPESIMVKGVNR